MGEDTLPDNVIDLVPQVSVPLGPADKDGVVVYMILAIITMLIFTKEDIGYIILLCVIFILSYNNVIYKETKTST